MFTTLGEYFSVSTFFYSFCLLCMSSKQQETRLLFNCFEEFFPIGEFKQPIFYMISNLFGFMSTIYFVFSIYYLFLSFFLASFLPFLSLLPFPPYILLETTVCISFLWLVIWKFLTYMLIIFLEVQNSTEFLFWTQLPEYTITTRDHSMIIV